MIDWFARNSVAANLLMFSVFLGGFLALKTSMLIEVFPVGDADMISVNVPLRSATPEDMELGIAVRIEESVQDLEGIKEIVSISKEGSTSVRMEIEDGYDPREILSDVKSRVDSINTFPADAEKPVIALAQRQFAVIGVTVSGDLSEVELRDYAERVRDELIQLDGISLAELQFARNYEISIEVSQDRLRDTGLSLNEIAQEIRNSSLDISAGNLRAEGGDVLIRSKGQAYRKDDFESIVVKTNPDGSIIRISDIATINDSFEEDSVSANLNGKNGLIIQVSRAGKEGALDVAAKVKEYIAEKQSSLPNGLYLGYWDDDSRILKSRLGTLFGNMWQGGLLVLILLTLFLRPSVAFWVFLGIPVSFMGAFMVLSLLDISINLMSLYGFILVLGLVVDDAIVTGESIYTTLGEKGSGVESAIEGTNRVAIPVTFGVLTTIAAFMPMLFLEGHISRLMAPVPVVIGSILFFSLIESKFVLPAHLKNIVVHKNANDLSAFSLWQQNFAEGFERAILRYYKPILERVVRHRYSVLTAFLGLFFVTIALLQKGWVPFNFMPRVPAETVVATLTMPVGTPHEVTRHHMDNIAAAAEQLRAKYTDADGNTSFRTVLAVTGSGGGRGAAPNKGRVAIETVPLAERIVEVDSAQLSKEWRKLIGIVPGAESLTFRAELARFGDPVNVRLRGSSFETLSEVADLVKQRLTTYPTVFEIADTLSNGKDELRIELNDQGEVLGLTRSSILNQIGEAFKGYQAQRIQRGRDDIRVLVRLPLSERQNAATLEELLIKTPDGRQVPLAHVATITPGTGPSEIRRIDRARVVSVTADFDKDNTNATTLNQDLAAYMDKMIVNYPGITYTLEGEAREQRDTSSSMGTSLLALLFLIYCLLALPLKSYTKPLVVMSIIPFSLVGAVLGHMIMGFSMAIMSYMGFLALLGVVVNDSLVLVDFINQSSRKGMKLYDAVIYSGAARFRAVMLTSLTTFFGLLPLMVATSTQSLFLIPMAISLGFGILFATAITLFLLPCNVLIANDCREGLRKLLGRNKDTQAVVDAS